MKEYRFLKGWISVLIILLIGGSFIFFGSPVKAAGDDKQQDLVDMACFTFKSFMDDPNFSWFHENLQDAKGLLIIPTSLKGGFVFGGSGGSGILVVKDEKTGEWTYPGFYSIASITFGLLIGGEVGEVIVMVMTQRGIEKLLTTSFKLGGDISITLGPVGAGVKGGGLADFIAFTKSKGAYAGVSFEGGVVWTRDRMNKAYYGRAIRPVDIFFMHTVSNTGADQLREELAKAGESPKAKAKN